jgi:UDP-glucose:(heptosyl)LPS alpha-1,3-glucosyltransferase
MERYVWELTHQLAAKGYPVQIICEKQLEPCEAVSDKAALQVIETGTQLQFLPRWITMLLFGCRLHKTISKMETRGWVIHSHERTGNHDISTFHGPSILERKKNTLDWISPRLLVWEWLERREILHPNVHRVVPVSAQSKETLVRLYPGAERKITAPIHPGTHPTYRLLSNNHQGKTIGFMGNEWRRKGLDLLVRAVEKMRQRDGEINLLVAGCPPSQVQHLFAGWSEGYTLAGWTTPEAFFPNIDLLALPSRKEPFGMVAAEANAAGIPVVVSDQCGIAPLIQEGQGKVVKLSHANALQSACEQLLRDRAPVTRLDLQWDTVADAYTTVYADLLAEK